MLFPLAAEVQLTPTAELPQTLRGKRLFYLFYEPSTRTRVSFETAVTLLGGSVAGMDSHQHRPDDERLEDRIRVLNEYPYDFLLVRFSEEGDAQRAASVSRAPIINAGDGAGQHPTQALLDVYTIWRELGRLDGLRIALVGDLSYERTTKSLAYLLGRFTGLSLYLVSPQLLRMGDEVREELAEAGAELHELRDVRTVAAEVDVIYLTRAQSARFAHARRFDAEPGFYAVDDEVMHSLPDAARILHPLPRGEELPVAYDDDPRVACFRQTANGLYVRMALLSLLAGQQPG